MAQIGVAKKGLFRTAEQFLPQRETNGAARDIIARRTVLPLRER
jgi:hypothetical protein